MKTAYIVIETAPAKSQPHFVGVFNSQELADMACTTESHMMAMVDINRIEAGPEWKYGYVFPRYEERKNEN
jgi:hypothetical protein